MSSDFLTLSTLGIVFSRQHIGIVFFFLFFLRIGFDISCKLSPFETVCMKCQILFCGKNKKNITNLSSAESAQRVVHVMVKRAAKALIGLHGQIDLGLPITLDKAFFTSKKVLIFFLFLYKNICSWYTLEVPH